MRVVDVKTVEDCFDGTSIMEVSVSESVTREMVFALGEGGRVQYFDHFPRPFFKVRMERKYDIKGIEGNRTMRLHLKDPRKFSLKEFVATLATLGRGVCQQASCGGDT